LVSKSKKSSQRWLAQTVKQIFPHVQVHEDVLHPNLIYKNTHRKMSLDVYLPEKNVAFEYQGYFHYFQDVNLPSYGPLADQKTKDAEKETACERAGITLFIVPFWWDCTKESLVQLVRKVKPDLISTLNLI